MPGVLESTGVTLDSRRALFYLVCTPIRLSLVALALAYHKSPVFQVVALVAAILSVYTNATKISAGDEVWWSRRFHLLVSSLVAGSVAASRSEAVSYLLAADIGFGLVSSFANAPW